MLFKTKIPTHKVVLELSLAEALSDLHEQNKRQEMAQAMVFMLKGRVARLKDDLASHSVDNIQ